MSKGGQIFSPPDCCYGWEWTVTIPHSCYKVVVTSWRDQMGNQEPTQAEGKKVLRRCSILLLYTWYYSTLVHHSCGSLHDSVWWLQYEICGPNHNQDFYCYDRLPYSATGTIRSIRSWKQTNLEFVCDVSAVSYCVRVVYILLCF